jgi:hypothetical protein
MKQDTFEGKRGQQDQTGMCMQITHQHYIASWCFLMVLDRQPCMSGKEDGPPTPHLRRSKCKKYPGLMINKHPPTKQLGNMCECKCSCQQISPPPYRKSTRTALTWIIWSLSELPASHLFRGVLPFLIKVSFFS